VADWAGLPRRGVGTGRLVGPGCGQNRLLTDMGIELRPGCEWTGLLFAKANLVHPGSSVVDLVDANLEVVDEVVDGQVAGTVLDVIPGHEDHETEFGLDSSSRGWGSGSLGPSTGSVRFD
jgi:hypothetical protein